MCIHWTKTVHMYVCVHAYVCVCTYVHLYHHVKARGWLMSGVFLHCSSLCSLSLPSSRPSSLFPPKKPGWRGPSHWGPPLLGFPYSHVAGAMAFKCCLGGGASSISLMLPDIYFRIIILKIKLAIITVEILCRFLEPCSMDKKNTVWLKSERQEFKLLYMRPI